MSASHTIPTAAFCADPVTKPVGGGNDAPKSVKLPYCSLEKEIEVSVGAKDADCCPFLKSDGINAVTACCTYVHRNDRLNGRREAINVCVVTCQL